MQQGLNRLLDREKVLQFTGHGRSMLKQATSWLQHSALRREVEVVLQALASSSTAAVQFSWLPVSDKGTSVALLRPARGPSFTLIITEVSTVSHNFAA